MCTTVGSGTVYMDTLGLPMGGGSCGATMSCDVVTAVDKCLVHILGMKNAQQTMTRRIIFSVPCASRQVV